MLEVLETRRAALYAQLGTVDERVVSRLHPLGGSPWPASALGRMPLVRRPTSWLLVTDGLSSPFDPELHPKVRPPFLERGDRHFASTGRIFGARALTLRRQRTRVRSVSRRSSPS